MSMIILQDDVLLKASVSVTSYVLLIIIGILIIMHDGW